MFSSIVRRAKPLSNKKWFASSFFKNRSRMKAGYAPKNITKESITPRPQRGTRGNVYSVDINLSNRPNPASRSRFNSFRNAFKKGYSSVSNSVGNQVSRLSNIGNSSEGAGLRYLKNRYSQAKQRLQQLRTPKVPKQTPRGNAYDLGINFLNDRPNVRPKNVAPNPRTKATAPNPRTKATAPNPRTKATNRVMPDYFNSTRQDYINLNVPANEKRLATAFKNDPDLTKKYNNRPTYTQAKSATRKGAGQDYINQRLASERVRLDDPNLIPDYRNTQKNRIYNSKGNKYGNDSYADLANSLTNVTARRKQGLLF